MKKLIVGLVSVLVTVVTLGAPITALAAYSLPVSYTAVYCYPTGSYWQAQIKAYPDYYAANDSVYRAAYGPGTVYCQ